MTGWLDRREREALAYLRRQSRLGGLLNFYTRAA